MMRMAMARVKKIDGMLGVDWGDIAAAAVVVEGCWGLMMQGLFRAGKRGGGGGG